MLFLFLFVFSDLKTRGYLCLHCITVSQHTSAALTINENYDSGNFAFFHTFPLTFYGDIDVRKGNYNLVQTDLLWMVILLHIDMDMALDNIVPESLNWRHTDEGPEYVVFSVSSFMSIV